MSNDKQYRVRAVHCDHLATDEEVYQALKRATDPLVEAWDKLAKAKRIGIKFNQDKPVDRWVFAHGQLQQLVSAKVARPARAHNCRDHSYRCQLLCDVRRHRSLGHRNSPPAPARI
jgi:hypothetical protein